jgi:hypothetical protein
LVWHNWSINNRATSICSLKNRNGRI